MAKRTLADQLDEAVDLLMAKGQSPQPPLDRRLSELLEIASVLRDLPAAEFKTRLKGELETPRQTSQTPEAQAFHTATPYLIVDDGAGALAFYKQAFGATELGEPMRAGGKIMHAEIQVGDSRIMLADEAPEYGNRSPQSLGGSPVIIALQVPDVDSLATQAVAAGARVLIPVADQFYGERAGRLQDPFGHIWILSTHKEDVSPDELRRRMEAFSQPETVEKAGSPEPEESYVVEPYLPVPDAARFIDFIARAFGAEETARHLRADGRISHAEARIGDSSLGLGDASGEVAPRPTALHLYVPDVEAVYQRALQAGATSMYEPADQPYGDREAAVKDEFGNHWYIATPLSHVAGAKHVPAGVQNLMPYLHPRGAGQLVDFLKQAFDAEEAFTARDPDGSIAHAKIRIGDSVLEMGEAHGPFQPMPTVFHLYVKNPDAAYERAIGAGGTSLAPPADQPWGYRSAGVQDPSGNQWWINAPLPAAEEASAPEPDPGEVGEVGSALPFGAVTPFLVVHDVGKTLDFLKEAFGAVETLRTRGGDPPHDHAEARIEDSMLMMGEAVGGMPTTSAAHYVYVADADAVYRRALAAGAISEQAPQEMPWGDRMAHVKDPFGNSWFIATRAKAQSR